MSTDASHLRLLGERLHQGDVRALARAISLVEDRDPGTAELLSECFPHTGRALRIGITGAPGAGKSTLVDRLARQYRESGKTVGVLAVDPSSPFTGGAILGDRIRLQERIGDQGLYVRSMATRGALGGLAQATADAALLLEASGKEIILLETVGVGQDEIDIVRLADITVLVLVPGMGDDVQSIKAGVMEIADIFVINKADREGADRVEKEIRAMQSLSMHGAGWTPPVVRTVAATGEGVAALTSELARLHTWLLAEDRLNLRRQASWRRRIEEMLRQEMMKELRTHGMDEAALDRLAVQVVHGAEDPWRAVPCLLRKAAAG